MKLLDKVPGVELGKRGVLLPLLPKISGTQMKRTIFKGNRSNIPVTRYLLNGFQRMITVFFKVTGNIASNLLLQSQVTGSNQKNFRYRCYLKFQGVKMRGLFWG